MMTLRYYGSVETGTNWFSNSMRQGSRIGKIKSHVAFQRKVDK